MHGAHRVESYADFVDAAAFYRRFDNPRCDADVRDGIVVSAFGGDTVVSVEAERGRLPRTELEGLSGAGVADAAWARGAPPWPARSVPVTRRQLARDPRGVGIARPRLGFSGWGTYPDA